ncbi:hypothetical protein KAR91_23500 [Candidatus Pacearchaeota archaeon]|nr:hypothetical protein [Candidatus Pacearchaeota archaeon]
MAKKLVLDTKIQSAEVDAIEIVRVIPLKDRLIIRFKRLDASGNVLSKDRKVVLNQSVVDALVNDSTSQADMIDRAYVRLQAIMPGTVEVF